MLLRLAFSIAVLYSFTSLTSLILNLYSVYTMHSSITYVLQYTLPERNTEKGYEVMQKLLC
jgi:hypothetical protein